MRHRKTQLDFREEIAISEGMVEAYSEDIQNADKEIEQALEEQKAIAKRLLDLQLQKCCAEWGMKHRIREIDKLKQELKGNE